MLTTSNGDIHRIPVEHLEEPDRTVFENPKFYASAIRGWNDIAARMVRMPIREATIRPACSRDAASVWPLARDFATSFVLDRAAFDHSFASLLADERTLLLVAEVPKSRVIGYLLANVHTTFLANGLVAWVEEVMVAEHARRGGVGRRLMERAETWAWSSGAAYLGLASRRAGAFYQALGYEESAVFYRKNLIQGDC